MLTIPLRVQGVDAKGVVFEAPARTVVLNRHGAQIQVPQSLLRGQTLHLVGLPGGNGADFRVVERVCESAEECGHFGVECLEADPNVWQVSFPSPQEGKGAEAKALLECRLCHTNALINLSIGELAVLRTAGLVAKPCQKCQAVSPWRYARLSLGTEEVVESMPHSAQGAAQQEPLDIFIRRRDHRRLSMQLPGEIRDAQGEIEAVRTVNLSRGGFAFIGGKKYEDNDRIGAIFPYADSVGEKIELAARIAWRARLHGTNRNLYGAEYEPGSLSGMSLEGKC